MGGLSSTYSEKKYKKSSQTEEYICTEIPLSILLKAARKIYYLFIYLLIYLFIYLFSCLFSYLFIKIYFVSKKIHFTINLAISV